jgi:hypothetical protein
MLAWTPHIFHSRTRPVGEQGQDVPHGEAGALVIAGAGKILKRELRRRDAGCAGWVDRPAMLAAGFERF